jgi:gamma-D-glutamyl-L-lysine dipeptidyl-peptidase
VIAALLLAAGGLSASEPALPASREAVVVVAVENMYSAADESVDVVSQATLGQLVEVLETSGPFTRVRTPDRHAGWLSNAAIREYEDPEAPRYARTGSLVEVASLMANVYREPSVTKSRPRVQAPLATRLEVAGEAPREGWIAVRLPAGDVGYIQNGDVRAVDASGLRPRGSGEEIVATARRFLGVPYLWGGMSAHGIDCSGLASRVYHANGVAIPRDADLQFDDPTASKVERAELQAGDLVFFGSAPDRITHVGLYVADGRFIDATTYETPVVRGDRLDDPHWSSIYQGARRPR